MDKMTLEKLDYNKLKEIVKGYCVSGLGKRLIDKLEPSNNMKVVKNRLEETSEGRRLIEASYHLPLDGIFNVVPLIDKIEKGASLEPSDLTMMSDFLRGCRRVKNFIKDKEGYAKILCSYCENISDLSYIEEEINRCIKGSIVDSSATKELRKIRQKMDECEDNINQKLTKFLKNSEYKKYIQEFFISNRNGRFTIPIKSAYKNNIPGEIIETSSKGLTVFMEPSVVKKYSLELESLKIEEKVEDSYQFAIGDKVLWLDKNKSAIVYKEKDRLNNVIIFVDKQFIEVNNKRLKLEIKAEELYPDGYDLNQIFISFRERKLERDIERGSKKAIKKIIKNNKAMKIEE